MEKYDDPYKDTNIEEYEIGKNYISVKFFDGSIYTYTEKSAGVHHLIEMRKFARENHGLNSYISRNKPGFESKTK